MLISGNIASVSLPDYTDPQYHNQYQNITVLTGSGPVTGRIGCKKPYTAEDVGKAGQWECEQATNAQGSYNKLKKYYAQPYTQQGQACPQQPQQAPSQATGQQNQSNSERDMRIVRGNSLNAVMSATEVPLDMVGEYLVVGVQFILTGKWSLRPFNEPNQSITEDDIPL